MSYSLSTARLELGAMRSCAAPLGIRHNMLKPRQQGSCMILSLLYGENNILELRHGLTRKMSSFKMFIAWPAAVCSGALRRRGMERGSVEE